MMCNYCSCAEFFDRESMMMHSYYPKDSTYVFQTLQSINNNAKMVWCGNNPHLL